jgi:hypothetical protein
MYTRLGAVAELRARMASPDLEVALGAYEALVEVSRSDITYVQDGASEALAAAEVSPDPAELDFGIVADADLPATRTIRLAGPPLACAVTVSQSEAWATATVEPPEVHVSVETTTAGPLTGTVTLTGPTGQVVVPVTVDVVPATAAPDETPQEHQRPAPDAPVRTTARPVQHPTDDADQVEAAPPADTAAGEPGTPPTPLTGGTPGEVAPATVTPAEIGSGGPHETPGAGAPVGPAPRPRQEWRLSGITAIVSGAFMLLSIVLPQRWGTSVREYDSIKATYLLYLGLVLLGLGTVALLPRWRIHGLGALIGASIIGTVVVVDMVNTLRYLGTDGLEVGFWVAFVAPFVLLASGALALAALRRDSGVVFVAFSRSDWASWLVVTLAGAGALTVVPSALEIYSSDRGWGLEALWVAVLAVCVPVVAVLAHPVLLGRSALVGWCLAAVTPVLAGWLYWEDQDSTSHGMWFVLLTLIAMAGLTPWLHRERSQAATP